MELSNKIEQVYSELKTTALVKDHKADETTLKEFSDVLNKLTVSECELLIKLHNTNNKAFKESIKGWGEYLLTPTSSLRYNLRIADLIDIETAETFVVKKSDGFTYPTGRSAQKPERPVVEKKYDAAHRLPPMGKGKYDKNVRMAHKVAKQKLNQSTGQYPLDMSFANLGSWDEIE